MREALYRVQFGDVAGPGYRNGGVAVLETNRVFGGDSGYYYLGTYAVKNDEITAKVHIVKHDPAWGNAFGDNSSKFEIDIMGQFQGQDVFGIMRRVGTQITLPIKLLWTADLP